MCKLAEAVEGTFKMLGRYKECNARVKRPKEPKHIRWIKHYYPLLVLNVDGAVSTEGSQRIVGDANEIIMATFFLDLQEDCWDWMS